MKVLLLENVDNLGKKYDIKEVKDGYARNFLIPKKLAKQATKAVLEWYDSQKEVIAKKAEEELARYQGIASEIDGREIILTVKVGDKGQLFEHITAQKIADKIKELGFDVKKSQIDLKDALTEVGEFPIKIKFEHNLEADIKIIIVAGENEENKEII